MQKGRGLGKQPSPRVGHARAGRANLAPTVVSQVVRDCPVLAWSERAIFDLREVICGWAPCGRVFWLCSGCDRGQRYCSDACREAARACNQRRARRRYARSPRGRRNNCDRQRRLRARQAARKRNGSVFTAGSGCGELSACTEPAVSSRETAKASGVASAPCEEESSRAQPPCTADSGRRGHRSNPVRSTCSTAMARHGETRRCHICGAIGRVARRVASRGRFRWAGDVNGWP